MEGVLGDTAHVGRPGAETAILASTGCCDALLSYAAAGDVRGFARLINLVGSG
jgi:hypothetical protein